MEFVLTKAMVYGCSGFIILSFLVLITRSRLEHVREKRGDDSDLPGGIFGGLKASKAVKNRLNGRWHFQVT